MHCDDPALGLGLCVASGVVVIGTIAQFQYVIAHGRFRATVGDFRHREMRVENEKERDYIIINYILHDYHAISWA